MPIGNYRPVAKPAAKPAPTPAKVLVDSVEATLETDLADVEEVTKRALTYDDYLTEVGLTRESARKILDSVLLEDVYQETVPITPSVTATFRTRCYQDMVRYHQTLERYQPKMVAERDEIAMRYFLASSLVAFRGESFTFPHPVREKEAADAAFQKRHDFVLALAEPAVQRLSAELHKFDKRVYVALHEGAVEFF